MCYGSGNYGGSGYGSTGGTGFNFALIVVLFILLIIVGATCFHR
ncbi:YjcZ family sporulation protein [Priestia megaterium]|nr:YjcZ family sporulation protein [Priestia megaterium]MCR8867285.1 YjcZ family sporulation protein [Priestia megaterium]